MTDSPVRSSGSQQGGRGGGDAVAFPTGAHTVIHFICIYTNAVKIVTHSLVSSLQSARLAVQSGAE